MLRLTSDLLARSPVFMNTLGLRELDLRGKNVKEIFFFFLTRKKKKKGNRLQVIENLGMTQDEYEAIDLSDNEISALENFPVLKRLLSLFVCNNHIKVLRSGLKSLPRLETLVLTNNDICTLADVSALGELPHLRHLSLLGNPVTRVEHYREYVLFKCPALEVLDFRKVKRKERYLAQRLFADAKLLAAIETTPTDAASAAAAQGGGKEGEVGGKRGRSDPAEEALKLRVARAIQTARTLDEVSALQRALQEQATEKVLAILEQIEEAAAETTKRPKVVE